MQSGDIVRLDGIVEKCLNNGRFFIRLRNGHGLVARVAVNSRSKIGPVILSDRVELSVSPSDMSQGKIDKRIL